MLALRAELEIGCPGGRRYGEALASALALHFARRYCDRANASIAAKGGLPPAQLRRVTDFIELHLGTESSLCRLAELVDLSPHHFAYAFKQSVGLPPHQYLLERRIARAKELLKNDSLSLAEIGQAIGYSSQAHFATMFREMIGMTPRAYRKHHEAVR
jgi:AraC family transcriptional regulator